VIIKRCATCGRFHTYLDDDRFCVTCGHETLEAECRCGRWFDYALAVQTDEMYCPRCGRRLRGRADEVE
jgi:rRNA maturation endonuclease Nob1